MSSSTVLGEVGLFSTLLITLWISSFSPALNFCDKNIHQRLSFLLDREDKYEDLAEFGTHEKESWKYGASFRKNLRKIFY